MIVVHPIRKKHRYKETMRYDFETKAPKPGFDNKMYIPLMKFKTSIWVPAFANAFER